jgi:hypothetical protein
MLRGHILTTIFKPLLVLPPAAGHPLSVANQRENADFGDQTLPPSSKREIT